MTIGSVDRGASKPACERHFEVTFWEIKTTYLARSRSHARYQCWLRVSDAYQDLKFGEFLKTAKVRSCGPPARNPEAIAVERFNADHPIGTPVRYWTFLREGEGVESKTRSAAQLVSGSRREKESGYGVVWVEGHSACISLTHVEVMVEAARRAA